MLKNTPLIAENEIELLQLKLLGFTNVICETNIQIEKIVTLRIAEFTTMTGLSTDLCKSTFIQETINEIKHENEKQSKKGF